MSRVPQVVVDPKDPQSFVEHLYRVQRVVDGKLEFGSPQDPTDPTSSYQADGQFHNGTILNLLGSWVEQDVAVADTTFICRHNLGVPYETVTGARQLNVRWIVMAIQHSGLNSDAASTLSVMYDKSDQAGIDENNVPLRIHVGGARTVNAPDNTVRVSLFIIPAVR